MKRDGCRFRLHDLENGTYLDLTTDEVQVAFFRIEREREQDRIDDAVPNLQWNHGKPPDD